MDVKPSSADILDLPLADRALMALRAAVRDVIEQHIEKNLPIYIWRDGKVTEVPPEELRARFSPEAA